MSNSISPFIKNQFPQYIQETDTLLIPFMEAYYEWMSSVGNIYDVTNDLSKLHNIDDSLVKFTEQFTSEYLDNFPKDIVTDKALTIKHINDLYKSKGTPAAVKLLLKIILGKDADIFYPSTQIFKPSDAEWIQENSIYVSVLSGNIYDIVGNSVKISTSIASFSSIVERVKTTEYSGIYEVFLERKLVYDITSNTIISYNNVVLESKSTTTSYKILEAGSGFKIGQIFNVTSSLGSGSVAKVKSITASGGIKAIQILKFGFGYQSAFVVGLSNVTTSNILPTEFPILSDYIQTISDSGIINKSDYFGYGYADGTYAGEILATFLDGTSDSIVDISSARIEFNLGDKLKYPGYYNNINGFPSDASYIQDNFYYQIYSYVVKIDEVISKYKNPLLATVHPAGMKMFSEYTANNNFAINTQLKFILNYFRLAFTDNLLLSELVNKSFTKFLTDISTLSDSNSLEFTKFLTDISTLSDSNSLEFTKFLTDISTLSDSNRLSFTKLLTDISTLSDSNSLEFTKNLIESITSNDNLNSISFTKFLTDISTLSDSNSLEFTKNLIESITSNDNLNSISFTKYLIESIASIDSLSITANFNRDFADISTLGDSGGIYLNYYTEDPSYWVEYSVGATLF